VLFGGDVDEGAHSGARFSGGIWLGSEGRFGIDASYFFLVQRTSTFNSPGGLAVLAFPFIDPNTGAENSFLVQGPPQTFTQPGRLQNSNLTACIDATTVTTNDPASGQVSATFTSRLQGADINLLWNPAGEDRNGFHLYFLTGYRWLDLHEELTLSSSTAANGTATTLFAGAPAGLTGTFNSTDVRSDDFDMRNQFNGWQFGAHAGREWGRFSFDLTGKVALGVTHEEAIISGTRNVTFNGVTDVGGNPAFNAPVSYQQQLQGGIFAQPSNIGKFSREMFAVVPEASVSVGYRITERLRATFGYNFLYWSNVARVENIINRNVTPSAFTPPSFPLQACGATPLPSPAPITSPAFSFHDSGYIAQGLCFGLRFDF
jgi:hypothetical protein